jgi:hypothetical protein
MSRDVGVGQLVEELEQRGDRLPFEIGAFVALEACEGLLQESVKLGADDVRVTLEGSVVVAGSAERAEPDEAARSLVSVLARLLVAAGPGVPPYLLQLVKEATTGQNPRDLRHLHDAIEASLIPINRGASRRVLARLVRESDRPPAPEVPQVNPRELDAELDELLRDPASRSLEPAQAELPPQEDEGPITERIRMPREVTQDADTATPPHSFPPPTPDLQPPPAAKPAAAVAAIPEQPPQPGPEPITATIRKWPGKEGASQPPRGSAPEPEGESVAVTESVTDSVTESATEAAPVSEPASEPVSVPASAPVSEPASVSVSVPVTPRTEAASHPPRGEEPALETAPQPVTGSIPAPAPAYDRQSLPEPLPQKRRGGWGVWLLAAALGLGAYALVMTGTLDALLRPAAPVAAPSGVIDVTVTPGDAQIFVFVGRGPAVASGLPVDGAHEFIVFDRGLRPSRAIVPEGAIWTTTERGSLYELAVQAQAAAAPTDAVGFGNPTTKPASVEAGDSGTIRIITNPQGAKVYRFIGVGPTAQIPAASIHEGQEILVYHPEHETRRAVIGPSDWQAGEGEGTYSAGLEVQLPELPGSAVPEALED